LRDPYHLFLPARQVPSMNWRGGQLVPVVLGSQLFNAGDFAQTRAGAILMREMQLALNKAGTERPEVSCPTWILQHTSKFLASRVEVRPTAGLIYADR